MKRVNAKTQWLGLWDYGNGVYKGNTIRKHELPPHAKLINRSLFIVLLLVVKKMLKI